MTETAYKPEVDSVRVRVALDSDSDASYLEQEVFADRLAEYQRGDFYFVGVYAEATIRFRTEEGGWTGLNTIRTPGLWSIESDSGEDYLREVGAEELHELAAELRALGITPPIVSPADVELVYA